MTIRRGDIVLVNFPFSSGTGAKMRPALVVQTDRNNYRLNSTIVAMVTSRTDRARAEPTQFLIEVTTALGRTSGLLHDSAVKCENLFTVERVVIRRVIGSLPVDAMTRIDACLMASLGIT